MSEYKIYPNVTIGENAFIGDYVVLGFPPRGRQPGELETNVGRNAILRTHTVIYAGNVIGENFQSGHGALIRENNKIGNSVSIGSHSVVEYDVVIEDNVRIHSNAFVPEFSRLEEGCWIGPCAILTNVLHPLCPKAKECVKGPTIKKGAKIGAGAIIMPDIEIGENALIGAGALVTENVPPGQVVVGNPARAIKSIHDLTCRYHLISHPYESNP